MQTFQITITGQVQGVGFRPFVFNLATQYGLKGQVSNNENGVVVRVNGDTEAIMDFAADILDKAPGIAVIQSHTVVPIGFTEYADFSIAPSTKNTKISIPLTADFTICDGCRQEIRDPSNRRFSYPFTTCTQCGPRYAITRQFPFERASTTLSGFAMCGQCETEYEAPSDIRFHSQTNSCTACGPSLRLMDANGALLTIHNQETIEKVAQLLLEGAIVAVKNTSGYLLCVDARNGTAVANLRTRKQRPAKPFALLYPSLEKVQQDFEVNASERKALTSGVGPIVILNPVNKDANNIASNVAPGIGSFGVMLPSSALLTLLMDLLQIPIVATSGNIHGSPILATKEDALAQLKGVADYFLQHNLDIAFPQDDSVVKYSHEQRIILRRSRGMAPNFLGYAPKTTESIMAMGAHLKSTLAFVPNTHTYVSPYFGNLDNYEVVKRLEHTIHQYTQLFETFPAVILVDKHPNYQSTQLGEQLAAHWQAKCITIQHHKAHFASVLAEHGLFDSNKAVLGVVWDGTGYGDDGMIWGGEFFKYLEGTIERSAHFDYFDWLAGDKMAKEPRLSLFSLLSDSKQQHLENKFKETELRLYKQLKAKNSLKTSSVGRLFDAVACLLDIQDVATYEGEAAMRLEDCAHRNSNDPLIDLLENDTAGKIPTHTIIERILTLKAGGASNEFLAASFIHTLACSIIKMAGRFGCEIVACSGGVFQNAFLVDQLKQLSTSEGLEIKFNKELSSNDENIAFGQLAYYENIKS